jgi:hypothetical protein
MAQKIVAFLAVIALGFVSWSAAIHHEAAAGHSEQMTCTDHCVPTCSIAANIIAPIASAFSQVFTAGFIASITASVSLALTLALITFVSYRYRPPDLVTLNCQYRF